MYLILCFSLDTSMFLCLSFESLNIIRLVVQSLGWVQFFATLWTAVCQASLSLTISRSLSKLMFIESVMVSSHLNFCYPLLPLPSVFPSIRVFSNELAVQVAKVVELQHQFFQ